MHYPVFLDLRARPVAVVGGGKVASAKIPPLVAAGARVTVIDVALWTRVGNEVRAEHRRDGIPLGERRPLLLRALNQLYGSH